MLDVADLAEAIALGHRSETLDRDHRIALNGLQRKVLREYGSFTDCRDVNHPWRKLSNEFESTILHRILVCGRCGTFRHDWFDAAGRLIKRRYQHADGYLIKRDGLIEGPISKEFWRGLNYLQEDMEEV